MSMRIAVKLMNYFNPPELYIDSVLALKSLDCITTRDQDLQITTDES